MEQMRAVLPYYKLDPSEMGDMLNREDISLLQWAPSQSRSNLLRIKGVFCVVEFDEREIIAPRRGPYLLRTYLTGSPKSTMQYPESVRVTVFSHDAHRILTEHLPSLFTIIHATPVAIGKDHQFEGMRNLVFRADLKHPVTTLDDGIDYGLVLVTHEAPLRHGTLGVNPFLVNTGRKMYPVDMVKQFDIPARLFHRGTLVISVTPEMANLPLTVIEVADGSPMVLTTTKELLSPCKFKGWIRKIISRSEITKCLCINGERLDPSDLTCFTVDAEVPRFLQGFGLKQKRLITHIANGSSTEFEDGYYLRRTVAGNWSFVKLLKK